MIQRIQVSRKMLHKLVKQLQVIKKIYCATSKNLLGERLNSHRKERAYNKRFAPPYLKSQSNNGKAQGMKLFLCTLICKSFFLFFCYLEMFSLFRCRLFCSHDINNDDTLVSTKRTLCVGSTCLAKITHDSWTILLDDKAGELESN